MRIGFVAHGPIQVPDGDRHLRASSIGLWCHHVAHEMAQRGATSVVYHEGGRPQDRVKGLREHVDGVDYVGIPTGLDHRVRREVGRRHDVEFGSPWYYPHYGSRVAIDARRRGLDVLVIANFSQLAPVVKRLSGSTRIVLHMHCDWLVQLDEGIVERRLRSCDLVGGVTGHVSDAIALRFPAYAARCFTLPNGVDLATFATEDPPDPNLVLFVGRSSPEKGLHVLIEAFGEVARAHPGSRLRLVGPTQAAPRDFIVDASDDPEVRALGRFYDTASSYHDQLGAMVPADLRDTVEFAGPQSADDIVHEYARAAVVVLPAVGPESFGMPVIEGGAAGRPVVVTDVGGLPEVVDDGSTGFIVPRNDAAALAKALLRLLDDPSLSRSMGERGRAQVAERFTWAAVADRLSDRLIR